MCVNTLGPEMQILVQEITECLETDPHPAGSTVGYIICVRLGHDRGDLKSQEMDINLTKEKLGVHQLKPKASKACSIRCFFDSMANLGESFALAHNSSPRALSAWNSD